MIEDVAAILEVPPSTVQVQLSSSSSSSPSSSSSLTPAQNLDVVTIQITVNNIQNATEKELVDGRFEYVLGQDENATWLAQTKQVLTADGNQNVQFSLRSAAEVSSAASTTTAAPSTSSSSLSSSAFIAWCTGNSPRCLGIFLAGGISVLIVIVLVVVLVIFKKKKGRGVRYLGRTEQLGRDDQIYSHYEFAAAPSSNHYHDQARHSTNDDGQEKSQGQPHQKYFQFEFKNNHSQLDENELEEFNADI